MRYVLDFGSANAGGSPTFDLFARLDTLAALTPPTVHEISDGEYYFDYDWGTAPSGLQSIAYKASLGGVELSDVISGSPAAVASSPQPGDLTSLSNLKGYLGIAADNTDSDALLARLITSVSEWFKRQVGRDLLQTSYSHEKQIHDGSDLILTKQFPVTAVSSLLADGTAVTAAADDVSSGYYLLDGAIWLREWFVADRSVLDISYTAGYAAADLPPDIEQAVIEMVSLKFRERLHVGNASLSALGTSVTFLPSMIPNSVRDVIEGYSRVSV